MLTVINNQTKIELLYAEQLRTGDKSTGWKIRMLELDNEEIENRKVSVTYRDQLFEMQKHVNYKINTKEISIDEFYFLAGKIEKQIKAG